MFTIAVVGMFCVSMSLCFLVDETVSGASVTADWKKNFGGSSTDEFLDVVTTNDGGFVAVGYSTSSSFNTMDWIGTSGKGNDDAIIVKYDRNGIVEWKKNFGGSGVDRFNAVTITIDGGFVAVGYSLADSFGNGDWFGISGKGYCDAIIVKFNAAGDVEWKKNFGGSGNDSYSDVVATSDGGFVAVGTSDWDSFGNGDWVGTTAPDRFNKLGEAIIVKHESSGSVQWKKNIGGDGDDKFTSVTVTHDGGFVAVGESWNSIGTGDWIDLIGSTFAGTIVEYDKNGNVLWKNGGQTSTYIAVTTTNNGFVAVGLSIVEYDKNGGVSWQRNLSNIRLFDVAYDGQNIIVAGYSYVGTSDVSDALIACYDESGYALWDVGFGGNYADHLYGLSITSDGLIVVGYSWPQAFGTGDWIGVTGKGGIDATLAKYLNEYEVTFNPNNGTFSNTISVIFGSVLTPPIEPSFTSKEFVGWFTDDGVEWNFSNNKVTNDLTLTAKWIDIQTGSDENVTDDNSDYLLYGIVGVVAILMLAGIVFFVRK